eukprot:875204-Pleurochrysis_carterae.AAC.3
MAASTDAKKVKAILTSLGWFFSPSSALIYQCSKYVALYSSKGYAIGAKFGQRLGVELHSKQEESFDSDLRRLRRGNAGHLQKNLSL